MQPIPELLPHNDEGSVAKSEERSLRHNGNKTLWLMQLIKSR